jgi:protoporphyrinogen oxidase
MQRLSTDTLIIGTGPAGLAAAVTLARAGKHFIVIERQGAVSGLSKTHEFREGDLVFRTDIGPHRFFSKNPHLYRFIESLLGNRWMRVTRQTRQFIDGKFYDYPVNAGQAFRNIGPLRAARMLADYFWARMEYGLLRRPVRNFADYVYSRFGRSLGEFNMINYTEKIWGLPASELHGDWAEQRIKGLSVLALAKDALVRVFHIGSNGTPRTLADTFNYPESGTGLIYETIRDELEARGCQILLNTEPSHVVHSNDRLQRVRCKGPEGELEIDFKHVAESIPVGEFLSLLSPQPPARVLDLQKRLRYRAQAYLFLTLDQPSVTSDQWIYFPEKSIPIGRMSEMRNFSDRMSPPVKTSLFLEFFCTEGDPIWNMNGDDLFEHAIPHLERMRFTDRSRVRQHYHLKERDVYPVYDVNYRDYLDEIKSYLNGFSNLLYIGRPGRFRYNNQDHSLEMGILAARSIIEGTRYDLDLVGSEKAYFERGPIPVGDQVPGVRTIGRKTATAAPQTNAISTTTVVASGRTIPTSETQRPADTRVAQSRSQATDRCSESTGPDRNSSSTASRMAGKNRTAL